MITPSPARLARHLGRVAVVGAGHALNVQKLFVVTAAARESDPGRTSHEVSRQVRSGQGRT